MWYNRTAMSAIHAGECSHLWKKARAIGKAILCRCVGKVGELNLVDSPALSTDADTNVHSHGAKQLIVGRLDPAGTRCVSMNMMP